MSALNILLLCGSLSYAGAQRQMFELAKGLNRRNNVVVCSIGSKNLLLQEFIENEIQVEVLNLRARNVIQILVLLSSIIKKNKIEVIYSFLDTANYFARLVKLFVPSVKIVVSERNSNNKISIRSKLFERVFSKKTDLYIANSYAGQLDLKKRFNIEHSVVIPNGFDINRFNDLNKKSKLTNNVSDDVIISMVARIKPQKNYEMFLKVAERVCNLYNNVVFFAIGDQPNPKDSYQDSILIKYNKLKNKDRIIFLGARTDISEILSETDISILTSHREGCSNTVLESMASKCPLVITDVGDNKIILSDENKDFVSKPGDVDEMVKKTAQLIDQPKLRSNIGEANFQKAKREFTVEKMVGRTESVILELLKT